MSTQNPPKGRPKRRTGLVSKLAPFQAMSCLRRARRHENQTEIVNCCRPFEPFISDFLMDDRKAGARAWEQIKNLTPTPTTAPVRNLGWKQPFLTSPPHMKDPYPAAIRLVTDGTVSIAPLPSERYRPHRCRRHKIALVQGWEG